MATLEERVTTLEEVIPTLATKSDLSEAEKRMNSRLYTALSEMEGRLTAKIDEVLKAVKEHSHA